MVTHDETEQSIYIFDDNQAMFGSLAENPATGFSEKLEIKTIGHIGSFHITEKDSLKWRVRRR